MPFLVCRAVGSWARIENKAVIGEDVFIKVGGFQGPRPAARWAPPLAGAPTGSSALACRHPQDEVYLNGAIVLPHKDIKESILEPGTIIM
jgi:mannose-1-phosphate guanylyltransferase